MADPDYFTMLEFRQLPDMNDTSKFPDARVLAAAAYITGIIEREVNTSFVLRSVTETLDGTGSSMLPLGSAYARTLTTVTLGGTTVDVAALSVYGGILRYGMGTSLARYVWTYGLGNVVVTYQAGYSTVPPADVKEAAMRGTRAYLLETSSAAGVMDRRSSVTDGLGTTTSYTLAGPKNPTGYPQVDSVIMGWKAQLDVFGFA